MQVKWTKRASQNLENILAHISADNSSAAKKFLLDTLQQISNLKEYPALGRAGLVPSTRELVIHENYVIYYRIKKEQIEILRVLHARRKYP
ncbi:type II toxin-antitoxin system RelE/ParE family toxin [Undibacterium amnicola]|uniref:Type II toxin-antitoxin system RelE/ParE family toxin n=1 Tax=Undibacterium amnicola TaxID=1834038 RepID=A0ABR6XW84_9BURK|nr:type II toxin-antitoxin system RelE/ParE family toxin [Undibacterium amnicola]MBC3833713.1 type II toxin-antitoxin system RelE/ParE family toxin [Undibacterium amnicola]